MDDVLRKLDQIIRSREGKNPQNLTWLAYLKGGDHILKKLGEEAAELLSLVKMKI